MDSKKKSAEKKKKKAIKSEPLELDDTVEMEDTAEPEVINDMYYDSDSSDEGPSTEPASRQADEPVNLPFQDKRTTSKLFDENDDSWMLFHLPTRLPKVIQQAKVKEEEGQNEVQNVSSLLSPVATPNLEPNSFDDCLSNAVDGKLGKLKIYKSGKAVLVLEGTEVSEIDGVV